MMAVVEPDAVLQRAKRVLQPRLVGLAQAHLPFGELGDELDPLAPGERPAGLLIRPPGGITAAGTTPLADQ